jgi:hypothetical protein
MHARVHQQIQRPRNVPVVNEEILFNIERRIPAFEFASFVVVDTVAEDEVLRPGGCSDGIRLNESHPVQRGL